MTTATKRSTIEELVNRTECKNREVFLKLHNYMLIDNNELYHYLDNKNELEDFLISRVDTAEEAYKAGVRANYPSPEELRNEALFNGVENSISEYVESLLVELPDFKRKLDSSSRYNEILNELIINSLPIFYSMISIPFSTCQETLDNKLIRLLQKKSKTYSFKEETNSIITEKSSEFQMKNTIPVPEKILTIEFDDSDRPF